MGFQWEGEVDGILDDACNGANEENLEQGAQVSPDVAEQFYVDVEPVDFYLNINSSDFRYNSTICKCLGAETNAELNLYCV